MTFTQDVKQEIIKSVNGLPNCCKKAFLSACLKGAGSLELSRGKIYAVAESENSDLAEVIADLSLKLFNDDAQITEGIRQLTGKSVYSVKLSMKTLEGCDFVEKTSDGLTSINDGVAKRLLRQDCCKRNYLKGLFVSCGAVVMPEKLEKLGEDSGSSHYHFELNLASVLAATQVQKLFEEFSVPVKVTERKNGAMVYIKDSEKIGDLLVMFNAYSAKMELENVKIERQMRNDANRQTNCISANIDKSVATAAWQISAIEQLRADGRIQLLDEKLKSVAQARLDNPDASLSEIAEIVGLTKSGARHRLDKLTQLAREKDK